MVTRNNLYVGNCPAVLEQIPTDSIDLVVTSPPYNRRKDYGADVSDEMPWWSYYAMMESVVKELYRVLVPGGVIAINVPFAIRWQRDHAYAETWFSYDSGYVTHKQGEKITGKGRIEPIGFRLFEKMARWDPHMREPIIWVKGPEGKAIASDYRMGCDSDPYLRPVHELILLGSKGRWFHRGGTGRRGKDAVPYAEYTKDVWHIPPVSDKRHPATFPIEIPLRLITLFVHAGDAVVLDPFCGIGTTPLACVKSGCDYIGIDANPEYIDIARERLEKENSQLQLPLTV